MSILNLEFCMDKKLTIRIDQTLLDAFSEYCHSQGSTVSTELRRAMVKAVGGVGSRAAGPKRVEPAAKPMSERPVKVAKPVERSKPDQGVSRQVARQAARDAAKRAAKKAR
jgi:hypothetical protein